MFECASLAESCSCIKKFRLGGRKNRTRIGAHPPAPRRAETTAISVVDASYVRRSEVTDEPSRSCLPWIGRCGPHAPWPGPSPSVHTAAAASFAGRSAGRGCAVGYARRYEWIRPHAVTAFLVSGSQCPPSASRPRCRCYCLHPPVTQDTALLKCLLQDRARHLQGGRRMNMHFEVRELEPSTAPAKSGLFRRILAFIARVLSSPKGDQGGWESGARGL
jgi:hypothetical protein